MTMAFDLARFARAAGGALTLAAFASAAGWLVPASAADKSVTIGVELPLTGADADASARIKYGIELAIEEANAAGGAGGYKLETKILDSATSTAGQYDPAQAATNAKKLVAEPRVVAVVGPMMSGEGKAMSPILSAADLAAITPSSTNPDISDPKFAAQYRPKGKAVYFRTVTTDAFQGPNMANYMRDKLKVKSVYILDDSGAYGVGLANSFEGQAKKIGINVLGRDQLNPKEADYTTVLTKIKAVNPDALYFGGVLQAGVKLAKQAYEIVPKMIKAGGDGITGGDFLKSGGFPAIEGWYCTIASPHVTEDAAMKAWVERFQKRFNVSPSDYSVTAYDGALVVIAAIKRVAASGKEVNRSNVRDAMQASKVKTLQGEIAFDENGDMVSRVISVFQVTHDEKYPEDDVLHQYKYIGVAPETPAS